jgi:type II secretory pathway component PulJ
MIKKRKLLLAISLVEMMVALLLASFLITGVTMIYFFAARSTRQGFEKGEAHQCLDKSMNYLLKDLRTAGSGVNENTCNIKKEDSIASATDNSIILYGDFLSDIPGIETVRYLPESNGCLARTVFKQSGTGAGSTWTEVVQEEVLIGTRPSGKNKSNIRLQESPPGFFLTYMNDMQTPYPSGTLGLEEDARKQVRRVDIRITITGLDGRKLVSSMNTTGRLRNLETSE